MISIETFIEVLKRFGHFASWAVWAEEGEKPKDNIHDLSVYDPVKNRTLLGTLHGNAILLGLNISRRIERPFGNFHDPRPMATDFKIRHALKHTNYWGYYMTDIIKDFEEKSSGKMMSFLRTNKDFERENIQKLQQQIGLLGYANRACSVASVNSILESISEAKASVASRAELMDSRMRLRW